MAKPMTNFSGRCTSARVQIMVQSVPYVRACVFFQTSNKDSKYDSMVFSVSSTVYICSASGWMGVSYGFDRERTNKKRISKVSNSSRVPNQKHYEISDFMTVYGIETWCIINSTVFEYIDFLIKNHHDSETKTLLQPRLLSHSNDCRAIN